VKDVRDVLRQKEADCTRLHGEIEALQLVIPLLTDDHYQSEWKAGSFSELELQDTGTAGPFFALIGESESNLWHTTKHTEEEK
jgi:hypothetical protein